MCGWQQKQPNRKFVISVTPIDGRRTMRPCPALLLSAALHAPASAWVGLLGTPRPPPYCPHSLRPSSSSASGRGSSALWCCSSSSEERDEEFGTGYRGGVQLGAGSTTAPVEPPPAEEVQYGFWAPASKELQYGSWAPASKNERFGGDSREPHVREKICLGGKSALLRCAPF